MVRLRKRPRAGHYRTRVAVYKQNPDAAANSDGEVPESALLVTERWAEVAPVLGTIQKFPGTQEDNVTHIVKIRLDEVTEDVDSRHWFVVLKTSQRLNVKSIFDADNRRRVMTAKCEERIT